MYVYANFWPGVGRCPRVSVLLGARADVYTAGCVYGLTIWIRRDSHHPSVLQGARADVYSARCVYGLTIWIRRDSHYPSVLLGARAYVYTARCVYGLTIWIRRDLYHPSYNSAFMARQFSLYMSRLVDDWKTSNTTRTHNILISM